MRRISLALLAVASVALTGAATASAKSLPLVRTTDFEVPTSASFTVNADWTSMLGSITNGQVVNCKDGSKTYEKTTDMSSARSGISSRGILRLAGTVVMQCEPEIAIANTSRTVTGTISSEAIGFTDATFSVTCQFNANLAVKAKVSVGLGVSGLVKIQVSSASQLPIACSFLGSGTLEGDTEATTIAGTIEGFAKVGDAATSTCAAGVAGCIPFSLDSVKVTITEATGRLDGYVGTGTYSYGDTFLLDEVTSAVTAVKNRVFKSGVRTSAVSPATMNVSLQRGAGKTVILRPAPAKPGWRGVVTPSSPIIIAAPVGTSCSVALKVGTKKWQSAASVVPLGGKLAFAMSKTTLSAVESKIKLKLKTKPVVDATVTCRDGLVTFTATEKLKLSL